jgi:hypothetical protein
MTIILLSSSSFLGTVCIRFPVWISILSILLTLATLFLLLKTGTTDPGYILRQEYPFTSGPSGCPTIYSALVSDPTKAAAIETQYFESIVCGSRAKLKYCRTCWIARPPRTSHCPDCDLCVEQFDHHCPWIGICIGKYNYVYYFAFLSVTVTLLLFNLGVCLVDIGFFAQGEGKGGEEVMKRAGASIFLGLFIIGMLFFVAGLFFFHVYLIAIGLTTNEAMKKSFGKMEMQPYDRRSFWKNLRFRSNFKKLWKFNAQEDIRPGSKEICVFAHSTRALVRFGVPTELDQRNGSNKFDRDDISETPSILHDIIK